jgi:trans-2,3-dihydro-3-hydroxyanthranilate isomerase
MPDTLPFHTLDVFTATPYAGNPLAVVLDAGDLGVTQMQTIAREFNLSETVFVLPPRDPAHTARVRIFFPTAEVPFAGHPTLGCAALLASLNAADETSDFDARITLEEEAGLVPVAVSWRSGVISGTFTAPLLPTPHRGAAPSTLIAKALGVPHSDIGFADHRPGLFSGGPAFLYVPLASPDVLRSARPIEPHWSDLMTLGGVDSAYLYASDPAPGTFRARMFSPTAGIPEDPATGSAAAILAGQLLATGALAAGETRLTVIQGVEMGRPSRLDLTVRVADGALQEVCVGGSAVRISRGQLRPPQS